MIFNLQSSEFLKPFVKTLSSNNTIYTKRSNQTTGKCVVGSSTKRPKQNSSIASSMNCSVITRSRAKILDTSIAMTNANNVNKFKREITSEGSTSSATNVNIMDIKKKEIINNVSSHGAVVNKRSKKCAANAVVKDLKTVGKKDVILKEKKTKKDHVKQSKEFVEIGLFDGLETSKYNNDSDYNIMQSPGKISLVSRTDKSRSETPPLYNLHMSTTTTKSIISEPSTPLSKSREARALKRVKAPKIPLKEEIKKKKLNNNKSLFDCEAACKKINEMLEFGNVLDEYGD